MHSYSSSLGSPFAYDSSRSDEGSYVSEFHARLVDAGAGLEDDHTQNKPRDYQYHSSSSTNSLFTNPSYIVRHPPQPQPRPTTPWTTLNGHGLVPAELLQSVRIGARELADIIPLFDDELSSAGWRQLAQLCLELVAIQTEGAAFYYGSEEQRYECWVRVQALCAEAAVLHQIANEVSPMYSGPATPEYAPASPVSPPDAPAPTTPSPVYARDLCESPESTGIAHHHHTTNDSPQAAHHDPMYFHPFFNVLCVEPERVHYPRPLHTTYGGRSVVEGLERQAEYLDEAELRWRWYGRR
ncbi:hypothetical protein EXIGLDRAFT_751193 [Exidia glandulosa HHB12029]|uniref:Uncharacterized protein n=1 Tax=Exidia glandulosa HHB12029 TaxID=1314781 RepID=A0A165FQF8_EXIGL|nr:hypothetical protein EXIGLDRAFT_751193 [Exidia glandulosa HHB12029]